MNPARLKTRAPAKRVPVNLITGFLGVGKTTAIRHLLAHKPAQEFWAVLVNEFGEVGIDGAALADDQEPFRVTEVPGGCICCTTSPLLRVSLVKLLRQRRPDRLLIEPSGLGHPAGIIDLLQQPLLSRELELRATLTLVDPRHWDDPRANLNPVWRDQITLADVLIGNKADQADAEQVDRFLRLGTALFPPKQAVLSTRQGVFDPALLDLPGPDKPPATDSPPAPALRPIPLGATPHRPVHAPTGQTSRGWLWPASQRFSATALDALFTRLGRDTSLALPTLLRAKGVFHTDAGWLLFNWADGAANAIDIAWRRDSRCELIASTPEPDWTAWETALAACQLAT